MALDVWCKSVPSRPFFFVAPEDRGGQQQHGPASIWQLAEVIAIVQRTREVTRSSAFACRATGRRFSTSPRLHQQTCLFSTHASFKAGHSSGSKETSCSIQARSVAAVLAGRIIGYFAAWLTEDSSQRKSCRCFRSASGQRCCKQQAKPLGMASQVRRGSSQACGEGANEIHGYSSSPWVANLSSSPDSLMDSFQKVHGCVPPCSRRGFLSYSRFAYSHMLIIEVCLFLLGLAGVIPAVADGGFEQVRGPARDLAVESLRRSSPVENAGTGSAKLGVGVVGACGLSDYGVVQVGPISWFHGIETGVSRRSSDPDSLAFNGSSWISFSSFHSRQTDSKPEVPVDQSSEFGQ